jgi:adenosylcobinamide kinase/adenosylcobinamide-phosphate guanylyltransferase
VPDRPDDHQPVLLGGALTPWGEPGCRCRACLAAGPPDGVGPGAGAGAPLGLQVGPVRVGGPGAGPTELTGHGGPPSAMAVGDAVEVGGIRVVGMPAATGVALVIGHRSGTLLWAPTPGPLPAATLDALAGAGFTTAVLGLGRPEGVGFPLAPGVAALRRAGALAAGCDLVAVGWDHRNTGPGAAVLLPAWSVRIAPDGAPLGPGQAARAAPPARRTLVLGAASSGKSATAEALLAAEPRVDYLPTGAPPTEDDPDWAARIAAHRDRRPAGWRTLEGADLADALVTDGPALLVDSIGGWVAAALERAGAWDDALGWDARFDAEVEAVTRAWRQAGRRVVAVGEETGWGVVPGTAAGRRFREALGTMNQRLAADSERVLLVVAGRAVELAGGVLGG